LENNSNERTLNENENKKVVGLKGMAYKDYIAARLLLQKDLLHQAAFFINTCIEKELKAYLFAHGISVKRNHDTEKLIDRVSQIESVNWIGEINLEFIKVINKIYESRYYETLEPGYNFVT
jgi:HEPN domain-containing protein